MDDDANNLDLAIKMLKQQGCFTPLSDQEINGLARLLVLKNFAAGQTIVTEGDHVDSVYIIISGTADVRHIRYAKGQPEINSIATLGPGQSIGLSETGFFSLSGIRTATVVAQTDMQLFHLSVAKFHGFTLTNSSVNLKMRVYADSFLQTNP